MMTHADSSGRDGVCFALLCLVVTSERIVLSSFRIRRDALAIQSFFAVASIGGCQHCSFQYLSILRRSKLWSGWRSPKKLTGRLKVERTAESSAELERVHDRPGGSHAQGPAALAAKSGTCAAFVLLELKRHLFCCCARVVPFRPPDASCGHSHLDDGSFWNLPRNLKLSSSLLLRTSA